MTQILLGSSHFTDASEEQLNKVLLLPFRLDLEVTPGKVFSFNSSAKALTWSEKEQNIA